MKKNLIYGINPLVISKFVARGGYRRHKKSRIESYKYKNGGWLAKWWYSDSKKYGNSYWEPAHVLIIGTNGSVLAQINCKSNKEAIDRQELLETVLDNFIKDLRCYKKEYGEV